MPIETGTRLGPYVVQDVLGQGAMGVVYRAYHAQLERTGAVKVMHSLAPDGDSVARFRHEAQAIAQMRHPNILNVFDFGDFDGTPYMIVEYVPGGSLAKQLEAGVPLSDSSTLGYLRGIAEGLDHAHSLGIVHRDVKPANVLLEQDGTPVLADFGLVKLLQGSSVRSLTGVTTGTPAYMAPEQVMGQHVGPAADRYSLATIAYEMLTGVIPFDGEGVMEVLYAQVHREPPAPTTRRPELGPAVDAVIMRGLAKDPAARWETSKAFVDALEQALAAPVSAPATHSAIGAAGLPQVRANGKTVERTEVVALPQVATGAAMPAAASATSARPSHRRRNSLVAAIAIFALLFLAFAYQATRPPSMTASPNRLLPGGLLTLTAKHLPANQSGEIQLNSTLRTYQFKANLFGDVNRTITVPSDIEAGGHTVRVCWTGRCRIQATIVVVGSAAQVSPVATASPTPSRAPSPSSNASPSPSASPSGAQASITLSSNQIKILTGKDTVSGFHFRPGGVATITFLQTGLTKNVASISVAADGTFKVVFAIPPAAKVGSAYVRACVGSVCAYSPLTVTRT